MLNILNPPNQPKLYYLGPKAEKGPLPAFFYFALSGEESLLTPPYNQPAIGLSSETMRVFSLTIPGHGEGFDKLKAMHYWAEQIQSGKYILEEWLDKASSSVNWLIEEGIVDKGQMAIGGLSRGGWIATQLASREPRFQLLLGFAPLTNFKELEEFKETSHDRRFQTRVEELDLVPLCEKLTHLHHIRFYIGNRDLRVGTDACYHFIRRLADKAHEKGARHCRIELRIYPSIGHKGHGTPETIFEEGSHWIQAALRKTS